MSFRSSNRNYSLPSSSAKPSSYSLQKRSVKATPSSRVRDSFERNAARANWQNLTGSPGRPAPESDLKDAHKKPNRSGGASKGRGPSAHASTDEASNENQAAQGSANHASEKSSSNSKAKKEKPSSTNQDSNSNSGSPTTVKGIGDTIGRFVGKGLEGFTNTMIDFGNLAGRVLEGDDYRSVPHVSKEEGKKLVEASGVAGHITETIIKSNPLMPPYNEMEFAEKAGKIASPGVGGVLGFVKDKADLMYDLVTIAEEVSAKKASSGPKPGAPNNSAGSTENDDQGSLLSSEAESEEFVTLGSADDNIHPPLIDDTNDDTDSPGPTDEETTNIPASSSNEKTSGSSGDSEETNESDKDWSTTDIDPIDGDNGMQDAIDNSYGRREEDKSSGGDSDASHDAETLAVLEELRIAIEEEPDDEETSESSDESEGSRPKPDDDSAYRQRISAAEMAALATRARDSMMSPVDPESENGGVMPDMASNLSWKDQQVPYTDPPEEESGSFEGAGGPTGISVDPFGSLIQPPAIDSPDVQGDEDDVTSGDTQGPPKD
jgi:hypothetical protein